ncbi:M28 family peptidase [bacterium]|nr:M28 family peptidase [bacterium]
MNRCVLVLDGRELPLAPCRPNGVVPPVTPLAGITGEVVHLGAGELSDFAKKSPKGRIAVLDYNSGRAWLRAFRLGARAVILVGNGQARAMHQHYVHAHANLPRFFFPGEKSSLPEGATVTVHSEVVWGPATGRNVLAFFRGTKAKFQQGAEEYLVIAAPLDSFGDVPRRSPGARGAANCAALLQLAEHFKANRPRRHIVLAFLDAQARGHAGVTAFYRAFETGATLKLADRRKYLDTEQKFLEQLSAVLEHTDPLQQESDVRRELIIRLKRYAAAYAYTIGDDLYEARKEQATLEADSARYAELEVHVNGKQEEKSRWNDLRRALARDSDTSDVSGELGVALAEVRENVAIRTRELTVEAGAVADDGKLVELVGSFTNVLHVSLALGDTSSRWGMVIGGDSPFHSTTDDPGLYTGVQSTFLAAARSLQGTDAEAKLFEIASADGSLDPPSLLWEAPFLVHSGEIPGRLGLYNIVLGTSQENLRLEGTPDDTLDAVNLERIEQQAVEMGPLLVAVADSERLSLRRSVTPDALYVFPEFTSDNRTRGPTIMGRLLGTSLPDQPMPNVVVQVLLKARGETPYADIAYDPAKPYAFDAFALTRTNQNGSYGFGPVVKNVALLRGFAVAFDDRGLVSAVSDIESAKKVNTRLNTVRCRHGWVVMTPQVTPWPAKVFRAKGNSALDDAKSFHQTLDGVVTWFCERKVEAVKVFGERAVVGLFAADGDPEGQGSAMEGTWEPPASSELSAADLWRLNESRLAALRKRGILNSSVEELHGRAEDLIIAARTTEDEAEREALAASAFLAERHVYRLTRETLNDLVHAVLVLLALSVPFAFALERLLIGATSVYRQIGWFTGFFVLTFLLLYISHPAFAIAKTPIIIFLGFAIVTLSALVITIIMRKFEVELKVLQGLTSTVHGADVSRFSTVMAAMSMGISTMRRRPLRTALTATTIIMLTFTILWFASFGTETGIVKLFVGPLPGHTGAFLHRVSWAKMNEDVLDVVEARWGDEAVVCRRYWVSPTKVQSQGPLVAHADASEPLALRGVLGLDPHELTLRADLRKLLSVDDTGWGDRVLMTKPVAEQVGLQPGDKALVGGLTLTVGPLLDSTQMSAARDMDGNGILPVDFVEMASAGGAAPSTTGEDDLSSAGQQNWAYLPTDSVVIVSGENAQRMGATLHAVGLYTEDVREATALAEDISRILPVPVSATRSDGVYRHVLGTLVQASGAGDLFFPILLGGLVIFGTMLGSVADREKEIYTFSSLGLAPPHVASLFFAEAMVYSVIGGLAGYLLAQGAMVVMSALASYGLMRVPEMNYSSVNAIVTILIVMGTVLISAIYPAIKASRSANPGILRTWRLPAPEGDTLDIVFPFTVSEYDITGVVSFLKEHFDNFGDTGLGVFMAKDARLVRGEGKALGLSAEVALAPFDLGVTQSFALTSAASEIPGIDEVAITIHRLSGQPKDWARLNKVLLDDLRRQFLIWRALPNETMELYRQRTLTVLGGDEKV